MQSARTLPNTLGVGVAWEGLRQDRVRMARSSYAGQGFWTAQQALFQCDACPGLHDS